MVAPAQSRSNFRIIAELCVRFSNWKTPMPDDPKNKGPQDRARVNIHEPHEVLYWCERFQCSEELLRECVQDVGVSAKAVELRIKTMRAAG